MPRTTIPVVSDVIDPQLAGDAQPLNATYFNTVKTAIEETPYLGTDAENGSNIGNTQVVFNNAESDDNLNSGEKTKTLFAKCKRWFSRLKALAFKDKINSTDINDGQVNTLQIANGAVTNDKVANDISGTKIVDNSIKDSKIESLTGSKVSGSIPGYSQGVNVERNDEGNICGGFKEDDGEFWINYRGATKPIKNVLFGTGMGNGGKITDLLTILQRLDDMGFKEGSVSGFPPNTATLTKQGKYAILKIPSWTNGYGATNYTVKLSFTVKDSFIAKIPTNFDGDFEIITFTGGSNSINVNLPFGHKSEPAQIGFEITAWE